MSKKKKYKGKRWHAYSLHLKDSGELVDLKAIFMENNHRDAAITAKSINENVVAISEQGLPLAGDEEFIELLPDKIEELKKAAKTAKPQTLKQKLHELGGVQT